MPIPSIDSPRLSLVAATLGLLEAELAGPLSLAALLGAEVPASWPPGEYDRNAQEYFQGRLAAASPADAGWFGWYAIAAEPPFASPTLVAAAGFLGPPDADGTVEIGYSVIPEATGRGFAKEAVRALGTWAIGNGAARVIAHTTRANEASIAVLMHCGFVEDGPGTEPGTIRFVARPSAL